MSNFENATAGNAPDMDPEGTRSNPPDQPAVATSLFERPSVTLDTTDRITVARAIEHLADIAHDLAFRATVEVFRIRRGSVLSMYPDAVLRDFPETPDSLPFSTLTVELANVSAVFFVSAETAS